MPYLGAPVELRRRVTWQALCECAAVAAAAGATEAKRSRTDTPAPASAGHAQRQRPHRPPRPPKATPGQIPVSARRDATAKCHHGPPRAPPPRRGQRRAQLLVRPASFLPRACPLSRMQAGRHRRDATDAPPRAGSTAPHHRRRGRRRSPTTPPSSRRCRGPAKEARPRPSPTSSS